MSARSCIAVAEFLPLIGSCNFNINIDSARNINKVNVSGSELILEFDDDTLPASVVFILPQGIILKKNFLTGMKTETSWISFRTQMEEKTRIVNSVFNGLSKDLCALNINHKDVAKLLLSNDNLLHIECKHCNLQITKMIKLNKVLPLPSVDWDFSSETWFCHIHDKELKPLKIISLFPKEDQCFYDDLIFYLKDVYLNNDNVNKIDSNISCKTCDSKIGEINITSHTVQFWANEINWKMNDQLIYSVCEKDILINLFENLDKESLGANCRIILKLNVYPKKFLMLATMDTNLTLLLSKESYLFKECDSMLLSNMDNSLNPPPSRKQKLGENLFNHLYKVNVLKILYLMKIGEDQESGSWCDDTNIHMLNCGEIFFNRIYNYLSNSNLCLPESLRIVNSMNVGYIVRN